MRQSNQPLTWFFHEQAEFMPTKIGDVPVTAILNAPDAWKIRLRVAGFTQTEQSWVKAGLIDEKVARYLSQDIELQEVAPSFFEAEVVDTSQQPRSLIVPKPVLEQLDVFRRGNMDGVLVELGSGGKPVIRAVGLAVLDRAGRGELDEQTAVVFEMAVMRLADSERELAEVAEFSRLAELEHVVGFHSALVRGEVIAARGDLVDLGGGLAGRLSADFHRGDRGAWLLKEPAIWVAGVYTAPDYVWADGNALYAVLAPDLIAPTRQETPIEPVTEAELALPVGLDPAVEPESAPESQVDLQTVGEHGQSDLFGQPEPGPLPDITHTLVEGAGIPEPSYVVRETREDYGVEHYAAPDKAEIISRYTHRSAGFDTSDAALLAAIREELIPAARSAFKERGFETQSAFFSIVGGKVYVAPGRMRAAGAWQASIGDQCPRVSQFADQFERLMGDYHQAVGFGLHGSVVLNSEVLFNPEFYSYLKVDACSHEEALAQAKNAAEFLELDVNEEALGVQADVFRAAYIGSSDRVGQLSCAWSTGATLEQACGELAAKLEGRTRFSEAMLGKQMQAAGIEGDAAQMVDVQRLDSMAGLLPDSFDTSRERILKVASLVPADQLPALQHLGQALTAYPNGHAARRRVSFGLNKGITQTSIAAIPGRSIRAGKEVFESGRGGSQYGLFVTAETGDLCEFSAGKLKWIEVSPTVIQPVSVGLQALVGAYDREEFNTPGNGFLQMNFLSGYEDVPTARALGVPYVMADGSFGMGGLYDSPTRSMQENGAFDRLFAYYQVVRTAHLENTDNIRAGLEQVSQVLSDGQALRPNIEECFSDESWAFKVVSGAAMQLYALDIEKAKDALRRDLQSPGGSDRVKNWCRGLITQDIGLKLRKYDPDGTFLDRILDKLVTDEFVRKDLVEGDAAIAVFSIGRTVRWNRLSANTTREGLVTNPRDIVIENYWKGRRGKSSGHAVVMDVLHRADPALADALRQVGLIDFMRQGSQGLNTALDLAGKKIMGESGHQDVGVVSGLAIKDLRAMTLGEKNQSFRAMTSEQRKKVAKRDTFVTRPKLEDYRAAGVTASFAAFMDRLWLDLPGAPKSLAVEDIADYGQIMAAYGAAFDEFGATLPQIVLNAEETVNFMRGQDGSAALKETLSLIDTNSVRVSLVDNAEDLVRFTSCGKKWAEILLKHVGPAWDEAEKECLVSGSIRPFYPEWVSGKELKSATWPTYILRSNGGEEGLSGFSPFRIVNSARALNLGGNATSQASIAAVSNCITGVYLRRKAFKVGRVPSLLHTVEWSDLIKDRATKASGTQSRDKRVTNHVRVGEDYLKGAAVQGEDFIRTFGFSGVEYGNWVGQEERQEHLNLALASMLDLAKSLEIDPMALSLGGRLGLCFGSRGRGGRNAALAHFEPANMAINLTRLRGDGSLLHEYLHAIAHHFAMLETGSRVADYADFVGTRAALTQWTPPSFANLGTDSDRVSEAIQKSFYELMVAIMRSPGPDGDVTDITTFTERSSMLVFASALDAEKKPYWSTPAEMFARAMESFLGREHVATGLRNDYLVAHDKLTSKGGYYINDDEYEKLKPFARQWVADLKTKMASVNHPVLGDIEMPVLYSKDKVVVPLRRDELVPFVENEFGRMMGRNAPGVVFERSEKLGTAGQYHPVQHLVKLALDGADAGVVYHEGWHAARECVLSDDDRVQVDMAFTEPELIQELARQMREHGFCEEAVASAMDDNAEAQAYAFQMWTQGQLDVGELSQAYERAKEGVDHIVGLAQLLSPEEIEQVFERVFSGKAAQAVEQAEEQGAAPEAQHPIGKVSYTGMALS